MKQNEWHSVNFVGEEANKMNLVFCAIIVNNRRHVMWERIHVCLMLAPIQI